MSIVNVRSVVRAAVFFCVCLFAVFSVAPAHAQIGVDKQLCAQTLTAPSQACTAIPGTGGTPLTIIPGMPVTYRIELNNPTVNGAVTLQDTFASGGNGFLLTGASCVVASGSNSGASFPLGSNAASGNMTLFGLSLQANQIVVCFISGIFTNPGAQVTNQLTVLQNNVLVSTTGGHQAQVDVKPALPVDLEVKKTVSKTSADISNGTDYVDYTITLTNNDPVLPAYLGNMLQLKDIVSAPPGSVPLQVRVIPTGSPQCTSTLGASCFDPFWTTTWTNTSANFGPWIFPAGSPGYIPAGAVITLTFRVEIRLDPNLHCVKGNEGLSNKAFFDLAGYDGTTITEGGTLATAANNSATSPVVTVVTGLQPDPDCDPSNPGPITITKTQLTPNTVSWASAAQVKYRIKLKNMSAQPVSNIQLRDRVQTWPGTPTFTATAISAQTQCLLNNSPCVSNGSGAVQTLFPMWQTRTVWDVQIPTMNPNDEVVLNITVQYEALTCDSYTNGGNIIRNYGRINYSAGGTSYNTEAFVDTIMGPRPPCAFKVVKSVVDTDSVVFGQPLVYTVTYENAGSTIAPVGTLIDAVRIMQPNYASGLPFTYQYSCQVTGNISGALSINGSPVGIPNPGGTISHPTASGIAVFTTLPSQGGRILSNAGEVKFAAGAKLTCTVTLVVSRPPTSNPYCLAGGVPRLGNLALMDVAHFYDPNQFPPSGSYNPNATVAVAQPSSPTSWSDISVKLPKCYSFLVNKSVSPTVTWSPNGPSPLTYTITITNTAPPSSSGPPNSVTSYTDSNGWHGPVIGDVFLIPTSASPTLVQVSSGSPACAQTLPWTGGPAQNLSFLPVTNFPANCTITITFKVNGPFTPNEICNRGFVAMVPQSFQSDWYAKNDDANAPPCNCSPTSPTSTMQSCVKVPVLGTSTFLAVKSIDNPAGVQLPPVMQFPVMASCTLPNGNTIGGMGYVGLTPTPLLGPIPQGSNCTVTEITSLLSPPPNNGICKAPSVAAWQLPVGYSPSQTVNIAAASTTYTILVKNSIACVTPPVNTLTISKTFNPPALATQLPSSATFPVQVTCTGPELNVTVNLTPASWQQVLSNIPVGSSCEIVELPPQDTKVPDGCKWEVKYPNGKGVVIPDPNGRTTIPPGGGPTLIVENSLTCKPNLAVNKVGPTPVPGMPGWFSFAITVTSPGGPFTIPANSLSLTDFYTAGGGVVGGLTVASGSWTCTGLVCTYTGTGPTATGQVLGTFTAYYYAMTPASYVNCASIALTPSSGVLESDLGDNSSCVPGGRKVPLVNLAINKTGPTPVASQPGMLAFTLTVSNVGSPFTLPGGGGITVTDVASGLAGVFVSATSSSFSCGVSGLSGLCNYNGTTVPSGVIGTITVLVSQTVASAQYSNCAEVKLTPSTPLLDSAPLNNKSCVNVTGIKVMPVSTTTTTTTTTPPSPPLTCDPTTTTRRGNACVCRFGGMTKDSDTSCSCPAGASFVAGKGCVRPPECRPPMVLGASGACVCPPGTLQRGRECVKPPVCQPPMIQGERGACICPPGTLQRGRECVKPPVCQPPMIQGERGACVCPPGTMQRGRECVKVPECRPPMIQGGRGGCVCPPNTVQRGRECVPAAGGGGGVKPGEPGRGSPRDEQRR